MNDKAVMATSSVNQTGSQSERGEHGCEAQSLHIDVATQSMRCYEFDRLIHRFRVSTSKHGVGQENGSYQTPRGRHVIRAKIGQQQPTGAVFVGRRPTGEIWSPQLHEQFPKRDWILSRILWLSGSERGFNRLGSVDSMRRFIYIHGTPDTQSIGEPASHGCVRMTNSDVIELFAWANIGALVIIHDGTMNALSIDVDSSNLEPAVYSDSKVKPI